MSSSGGAAVIDSPSVTVERYGRVIKATVDTFVAECFTNAAPPPLGELLVVEDGTPIVAIVADVSTESRDGTRPLGLHGGPEDDLAHVLDAYPHIPALLRTCFTGVVAGYWEEGRLRQYLPSAPPPVQARVRRATFTEYAGLTSSFDFLRLLLDVAPHADDAIAAALRRLAPPDPERRPFLVRAGKALTMLLTNDPPRLHALLRRLQG
jgi:hypothetical protein